MNDELQKEFLDHAWNKQCALCGVKGELRQIIYDVADKRFKPPQSLKAWNCKRCAGADWDSLKSVWSDELWLCLIREEQKKHERLLKEVKSLLENRLGVSK